MVRRHLGKAARGFTLIELLVVVSIIALLLSILLPSLKKARIQAKLTKCAGQLHDIGVSLTGYSNDFNRFPRQNRVRAGVAYEGAGFWTLAVHRSLAAHTGGMRLNHAGTERTKAHEVFYCPDIPDVRMTFSDVVFGPDRAVPYNTPSDEDYLHIGYAYYGGLHEVANDPAKPRTGETEQTVPRKRKFYAKTEPDAARILMADWVMRWGSGGQWRINHGVEWGSTSGAGRTDFAPPARMLGANELFGDSHVEWRGPSGFAGLLKVPAGYDGLLAAQKNAELPRGVDSMWW